MMKLANFLKKEPWESKVNFELSSTTKFCYNESSFTSLLITVKYNTS